MNQKDLEYLRKMEEEKEKRAFSNQEIENIHNCLRTNVGANDTNEALDLSASIVQTQVKEYGADADSLLDTILHHADLNGAEDATEIATSTKFALAAHFIDSEQYDKFESMNFRYINKEIIDDFLIDFKDTHVTDQTPFVLMDKVKTLKGMQYLLEKEIIPQTINMYDDYDHLDTITTVLKDGTTVTKNMNGDLLYTGNKEEGKKYTDLGIIHEVEQNTKTGTVYGPFKHDDNSAVSWYEYNDDYGSTSMVPIFEDEKGGWHEFDYNERFITHPSGVHSDKYDATEEDLEKYMSELENRAFIKTGDKTYYMEKGQPAKEINLEKDDSLELRMTLLRKKLGDNVGKTADVKTGEITDKHRENAKTQVEISKAMIKAKRER